MATHAQNIDNLQNAVYGEEVRTSMIELFNEDYGLVKKAVGIGTDITGSTSSITGYYEGNLYINNSTMDIWQMDGSGWTKVGNLKTISSIDTQESQADAGDNAITINFSDGTVKSFNVRNGSKGSTGVSVTGVVDNRDGTFCLTLSDGTRTGNVETIKGLKGDTGAQGPKGDTGDNGRGITSITSANSGKNHVLSANYTDGQSSIICTVRDGNDGAGTGDMLKATYDTADRGYVDFAEQLTDGTNSVTVTDVRNKADKATTLAGYGITNAYTKTEVDDLLDAVEPTWGNVEDKPFDGLDSQFFDTTSDDELTIKSGSLSKYELESNLQNDLQSIPSCDAWDGEIVYAKDDICIYNNIVRKSLADNNQGNYPSAFAEDNTYWKASSLNGEFGALNTALIPQDLTSNLVSSSATLSLKNCAKIGKIVLVTCTITVGSSDISASGVILEGLPIPAQYIHVTLIENKSTVPPSMFSTYIDKDNGKLISRGNIPSGKPLAMSIVYMCK